MKSKIMISAATLVICGIVIYLANTARYFGVWINKIYPCHQAQEPMTSFPCFAVYDLFVMFSAAFIGLVALGFFLFFLVTNKRKE